jgi:hypothetical protein
VSELSAHFGGVLVAVQTGEEMDDASWQSNDGLNSGTFQCRFIENRFICGAEVTTSDPQL